jgi:hypothetical protein
LLFMALVGFIFWLGSLGEAKVLVEEEGTAVEPVSTPARAAGGAAPVAAITAKSTMHR